MKKKLNRIIGILLCTIMICTAMPFCASAAITEEYEDSYSITTFEDLKTLAAGTYQEDDWISVYYYEDTPLVIEETITIPENLALYFHSSGITVPYDVVLTLNSSVNYFSELSVQGTVVNNTEVIIETSLTVNGRFVNNGVLRPSSESTIAGFEKIASSKYGYIMWPKPFTNYNQMKEYLTLAKNDPDNSYEIYYDYESAPINIHITDNLIIPENVWFHGDNNFTLTVDNGYTLTNNGEFSFNGGSLIIDGTFYNNNYMHLGWLNTPDSIYHGTMKINAGGSYTGNGYIFIATLEPMDYQTIVPGLDLSLFHISSSSDETSYYWYLESIYEDSEDPVPTFSDVSEDAFYFEPVLWAVETGITNGTGNGQFSPDDDCTRGQVVTFLWRAAGEPEPVSLENPFTDVKSTDFYYKAVLWAVENGITTGTGNGQFSPEGICSRAQVATFLWRAENNPSMDTANNPFTDVDNTAYYYDAVLWAVENEITNGTGNGQFSPDVNCNRGQIVTFLFRSFI